MSENKLNFHYNRDERISMMRENVNKNDNCFFCKKNRHVIFILVDLILILMVIVCYNFFIGKSKNILRDGVQYHYSKKLFGNYNSENFIFQIKNNTKKIVNLKSNEAYFMVLDGYGVIVYSTTINITKSKLESQEFFIETISFGKLEKGRYLTRLVLNNEPDVLFEMYYKSK